MISDAMLELVKSLVSEADPSAELILYGSRARGTASAASDWDFLILSDMSRDRMFRQAIRARLYEIEWATGEVISIVLRSHKEWSLPILQHSPFHMNVEREGIHL